ncbi:hypothetical protein AVEN_154890-1 [Araneus ventricosus]|uniref:Uncharacterized protein n=1 Tax=Araneus ventricosus TaxID=182803 RepID=A0A4Y2A805_ARAVE|nr:hypothetical protein AVEN_154890-1 [Araneus ventricosus]
MGVFTCGFVTSINVSYFHTPHCVWEFQATIFCEGEENVDTCLKGFQISKEKDEIFELLDHVKLRGQEIAEDDAFEVLHCDDEAPIVCQLTLCRNMQYGVIPKLLYPIARIA